MIDYEKNMFLFSNIMNLNSTELGKYLIDVTIAEILRPSALQLCYNEIPTQMFSCEYCKVF